MSERPSRGKRVGRRPFLKSTAAGAAALSLAMLNTRPVRAAKRYVVRIGSVWRVDNLTPDVEVEFMDLLRKYSNDEFDPKFFAAGALGSALERSQKLQTGTLEVSNTSLSNFAAYVPLYNILNFPYVTKGYEGTMATIRNGIKITESQAFIDAAGNAAKEKGFVFGFWTPIGVRQVALRKQLDKTVRVPDDMKGVKMRVTGSFVERKVFEFLGANPVPISWPETMTSIQKGVADGIHNSSVALLGFNFADVVGTVTKTNFYPTLNLYVASRKWFDGLPSNLQNAFLKACRDASEIQSQQLEKSENMAVQGLEKAGVKFYEPTEEQYKQWYDAVNYKKPSWEPIIKKLVGDVDTFNRILGV